MNAFYFWIKKMLFKTYFKTEHFENWIFAETNSTHSEKRNYVICFDTAFPESHLC